MRLFMAVIGILIGNLPWLDSRAAGRSRCSAHVGIEGSCREGATKRDLRELRRRNPRLRHLTLRDAAPFLIAELERFEKLSSLEVWASDRGSLDNVVREMVALSSKINKLTLHGSLSALGMRGLGQMKELEHLNISSASLPTQATNDLAGLAKLKFVRARAQSIPHFRGHSAIQQLWVASSGTLSNADVEVVGRMKNLIWLKADVAPETDPAPLGRLTNLKWLDFTTGHAPNDGQSPARALWISKLVHLNTLALRCTGRCRTPQFDKLKRLQDLTLWVSGLDQNPKWPTSLRSLRVPNYMVWTDSLLASVGHLKNLRELVVRVRPLTDSGAAVLSQLRSLQRLALWDVEKLGPTGLAHLERLSGLKALDLSGGPRLLFRYVRTLSRRNVRITYASGGARWTRRPPIVFPNPAYKQTTPTNSRPRAFSESLGSGPDRVSVNVKLVSAQHCQNKRGDIQRWVQRRRLNILLCMSEANRRQTAWRRWGGKLRLELHFGANQEVRRVGVKATTTWYKSGGLGKCLRQSARRFRYREKKNCRLQLDVELAARPER